MTSSMVLCVWLAVSFNDVAATDMTGRRELQMMRCPSAAPGASTTVVRTRDGVKLIVTAPTEFGRSEIRRRAAAQQKLAARPARGREEHTGQGTGSGRYGFCPGMMQGTTLTVDETAGGATILVHARREAEVRELQRTTLARAAHLKPSQRASAR
jgi:hypothetical protein